MSTSELFNKHFGDVFGVGLKHPNIEPFFEELNQICLKEAFEEGRRKDVVICPGCSKFFELTGKETFLAKKANTDPAVPPAPLCKNCEKTARQLDAAL
jgi:hypothetical protein